MEKQPNHEQAPKPIFDDCSNCEQRYQLTPDNCAGYRYNRQHDCDFIICVCPNCSHQTKIFINQTSMDLVEANGMAILEDEFADDNTYADWCELKGIELPKTYELTTRHEQLIGRFAMALAETPDEYLFDLIADTGYDQPYPQRWT